MGRAFFNSSQTASQAVPTAAKRRGIALHVLDQPRDLETLLTTEQVRLKLGLGSTDAVYRLVKEDGLPRLAIGRVYRFSPSAVAAWVAAQNAPVAR